MYIISIKPVVFLFKYPNFHGICYLFYEFVINFCESNDNKNWARVIPAAIHFIIIFSTLPPTECCQLQATVKHKPLIGGDQILGVASVP